MEHNMNWIPLTIITLTLANPFNLGIAKSIADGTTTAQLDKVLIQEMSDNSVTEILGPDGGRITACGEAYVEMEAGFLKEDTLVTIECSDEPLSYADGTTDDFLMQFEPIADKVTVSFNVKAINSIGDNSDNNQSLFIRVPAKVEIEGNHSALVVYSLDGVPKSSGILQYRAVPGTGKVTDISQFTNIVLLNKISGIADARIVSISIHPNRSLIDLGSSRIQEISDNPVTEILGSDGGRITACGEAYVEMEAGFLKENTVVTIECSDEPLTYPSGKTDDVLEQYEPIADKATVSFKASAINAAGLSAEDYPDLSAENYQGVFTRIPAIVEAQGVNSVQ